MRKICLHLEWGAYPIQELDSNSYIIDDMSAEELGFSDDFCEKIKIMQKLYNDFVYKQRKRIFVYWNEKTR